MLTIALLAVLTSSSEKQAVHCGAACASGMSQPSQNRSHWLRNTAHCAGEHPMSMDGRMRAGGRTLDPRILGAWAGCSANVWLTRSCAAACWSPPAASGTKVMQFGTGHTSAIFEDCRNPRRRECHFEDCWSPRRRGHHLKYWA